MCVGWVRCDIYLPGIVRERSAAGDYSMIAEVTKNTGKKNSPNIQGVKNVLYFLFSPVMGTITRRNIFITRNSVTLRI